MKSVFRSERVFPVLVPDLGVVGIDLVEHFKDKKYQAVAETFPSGICEVSITRGGVFKSVAGLKTALKVELREEEGSTHVRAGIGIFGQQAIPALVTYFVAWPVLVAQVWGLIRQAKLDDEAIEVAGESLRRHAAARGNASAVAPAASTADGGAASSFCTECGTGVGATAKFCPECGTALDAAS